MYSIHFYYFEQQQWIMTNNIFILADFEVSLHLYWWHAVVQVYVNKSRLYFPRGFLCKNSIYLFIFGNVVDLNDRYGEINNIAKTISSRNWFYRRAFYVGFLNMQIKKLLFSFFLTKACNHPSSQSTMNHAPSCRERIYENHSIVCYRKVG